MDIIEAVQSRKSIRNFKPDPVPREVLREILEVASRSPSATNSQPWELTVLTGQPLEELKRAYIEMLDARVKPKPDIPMPPLEGEYRQRQVDVAVGLFKLMGIARDDTAGRVEWQKRGFRFFDAPAAIILSLDRCFDQSPLALFDLGAIAQTICLVALSHGLGTCIARQGTQYADVLRGIAGIPDTKRVVISIAIGYPDWDFPANAIRTEREPLEGFVTWCGWD